MQAAYVDARVAGAYDAIISQRNAVIVSDSGRLGYPFAPADPGACIDLLKEFLQRVQQFFPQPVLPPEPEQWVVIETHKIDGTFDAGSNAGRKLSALLKPVRRTCHA